MASTRLTTTEGIDHGEGTTATGKGQCRLLPSSIGAAVCFRTNPTFRLRLFVFHLFHLFDRASFFSSRFGAPHDVTELKRTTPY